MLQPDAVDVIVQFLPKLVELGVGEEECVEGEGNDHFADHFDAESGHGQQPRTHQMGRPQQGKANQSNQRQRCVNG